MSIIKNFRNPWEDDNWVLQTDVLDTSVLDTDVLNNDVLKPPYISKEKSYFAATLHGSWWDNRIFEYIYEKENAPNAQRLLEVIILGSIFRHMDNITDDLLRDENGLPIVDDIDRIKKIAEIQGYRRKNWGLGKDYPITLTNSKTKNLNSLSVNEIMKEVDRTGEFRIILLSDSHDEYGNNLSHKPQYDAKLNRGSIVIKAAKGMKDSDGVQYWSGWFVMNSPFGKMFRHVGQHRDPWTGELLTGSDKIAMTFDGILDLLTLGVTLKSALVNQGFNIGMGILEKYVPSDEFLTSLGISREIYEMYKNLTEDGLDSDGNVIEGVKGYSKVEFVANLLQFGMLVYKGGKIIANNGKSSDVTNITTNEAFAKRYIISYEEN